MQSLKRTQYEHERDQIQFYAKLESSHNLAMSILNNDILLYSSNVFHAKTKYIQGADTQQCHDSCE